MYISTFCENPTRLLKIKHFLENGSNENLKIPFVLYSFLCHFFCSVLYCNLSSVGVSEVFIKSDSEVTSPFILILATEEGRALSRQRRTMTKAKKEDKPVAVDEYIEEAIHKVRKIEQGNKLSPMNSTERYGAALAISQLIDALNALAFEGSGSVIKDLTGIQSQLHDETFGPIEICYALYAALGGGTATPRSDGAQGDSVEQTVGGPGIDFCGKGKKRSRKAKQPKKIVVKEEVVEEEEEEEGEKVKQTRKRKHQQSNVESGVKYVKHFELGNDKRVSIKTVVADVVVSVRQWQLSPKGVLKSGKKGLTFSVDEWLMY